MRKEEKMKKVYEKPNAYIETFELSQHVASCDFNIRGNTDVQSCYAVGSDPDYGTAKVFMTSGICDVIVEDYCNYNSVEGNTPLATSY